MKGVTKVKLTAGKKSREFSLEEAQAIIQDEAARGSINWVLPDNSPFKLNNGIIERTDSGADKKSAGKGSTSKSSQAGK